jgi:hypothetical protein
VLFCQYLVNDLQRFMLIAYRSKVSLVLILTSAASLSVWELKSHRQDE